MLLAIAGRERGAHILPKFKGLLSGPELEESLRAATMSIANRGGIIMLFEFCDTCAKRTEYYKKRRRRIEAKTEDGSGHESEIDTWEDWDGGG